MWNNVPVSFKCVALMQASIRICLFMLLGGAEANTFGVPFSFGFLECWSCQASCLMDSETDDVISGLNIVKILTDLGQFRFGKFALKTMSFLACIVYVLCPIFGVLLINLPAGWHNHIPRSMSWTKARKAIAFFGHGKKHYHMHVNWHKAFEKSINHFPSQIITIHVVYAINRIHLYISR